MLFLLSNVARIGTNAPSSHRVLRRG